jgi:hypothetical protein
MAAEPTLSEVIDRMTLAVKSIEGAVETREDAGRDIREAEEEVQRMNADRMRLAQELDGSEARAERLEKANKEVSRRLVAAMETIRAVLDR